MNSYEKFLHEYFHSLTVIILTFILVSFFIYSVEGQIYIL